MAYNALLLAVALSATIPWCCVWLFGAQMPYAYLALLTAMAITGAALLISWAAESAQVDVSRSLSLAMLSLITVMPEYAVDIYLSWRAGRDAEYVGLACANMTGGNRLLIGVGWSLTALLAWWSMRRLKMLKGLSVPLDKDIALEIVFLSAATLYSFLLPLKGTISPLDAIMLAGLYIGYVSFAIRAPKRDAELFGPAKLIASMSLPFRRVLVLLLFAYSGFVIFISAEPLAESLKELGKLLGIGEFFMIQWIAPLASESPELIVVSYFAMRALPAAALTAIISAKLNQWTLLIGSLPIVYSISSGAVKSLPLIELQRNEILLTAAQSLFGCIILASFDITILEIALLFALFVSQLLLPMMMPTLESVGEVRTAFAALYIALSIYALLKGRNHIPQFLSAVRDVLLLRCSAPANTAPQAQRDGAASWSHRELAMPLYLQARNSINAALQFCGAAMEVTGSCHLLTLGEGALLLDCGLIQGGKERHLRNREPFPFDPSKIDACLLTHAHLDHCGRLPLLIKRGFKGRILATKATCELSRIVLLDSAKLNEEDAAWKIKRLRKAGEDHSWVTPLFTTEDALKCIERFEPVDYHEEIAIGNISIFLREAGHILGSAIAEVNLRMNGNDIKLVYTGDLGRRNAPIIRDPELINQCDLLITEGTYAGQVHGKKEGYSQTLVEAIERTRELGGKLLIPSFAIERAQDVLYVLGNLFRSGTVKPLPVFVDSPMAIEALNVFKRHIELYDEDASNELKRYGEVFSFECLYLLSTVEESKMLNSFEEPCIIIAGNGMCTGGRIKHHLKHHISDPRSTILFVGYQANGTLGRHILEGERVVRIFGENYEVRANVAKIEALSGHADQEDLDWWFSSFRRPPRCTFAVHGEAKALMSLRQTLTLRGWKCVIPTLNEVWELGEICR
ncbi:MAG: MBL fold metallo-hydrolase [Armatimonadetes bacterium]|nr:MBL fold metallo-hydrolase [Armatimonadota bacterium]